MEAAVGEDVSGEGTTGSGDPPRKTAAAGGGSQERSTSTSSPTNSNSQQNNNKTTRTHGERWEESFQRLVAFQKRHGHCNIPYRYEEDPFLGRWVSLQRSIYKSEAAAYAAASGTSQQPDDDGVQGAATTTRTAGTTSNSSSSNKMQQTSRIQRLNEIGFDWNPQESRHVSWEQRYGELCDFVSRNGHARVPLGWKENIQLAHWVSAQRREYKLLRKGLPSRLTHDRLQKLEKINFLWRAGRGGPRVPSSGRDAVDPLLNDAGGASDDPTGGVAGAFAPVDSQPPIQAQAGGTAAITAGGVGSGYTLPPGTAFLLTNAGAFPAILTQPSALAPLQGLAQQQQQQQQAIAPAPVDPSQAAVNTSATAAAAAATVLNLFPILAQTAAATAAVPAASITAPSSAPEDPNVAALRLLMSSGIAAATAATPTPGINTGVTGAAPAAPAAALVIPSLPSVFGTAPASAPVGAIATSTGPAAPTLDPQAAMNLALTLQLLTRAQAGTGVQSQQPQLAAPPTNAAAANGNGNDVTTDSTPR